ncbi:MAG: lysylphosphatidylglycerol synthase transmembrane domain-containing protein [Hyphomonadaceae bacterium]
MPSEALEREGNSAKGGFSLLPATAAGWAWFAAKLAFSAGLLAFALSRVDVASALAAAKDMAPAPLAAAMACVVVSVFLVALRWRLLLRAEAPLPYRQVTSIVFTSQFVGQVLPAGVGQDAVRVWLATRAKAPLAAALSSIVLDRLCGMIALVALILVGAPRLAALGGAAQTQAAAATVGLFALAVAIVIACLLAFPPPGGLPRRIEALWLRARLSARQLCSPAGLAAAGVSLGVHAVLVLAMWLIALGVGAKPSLLDAFAAVPPAIFLSMLPISVNGWGVREGVLVLSLGLAGVSAPLALLTSLLFGLAMLITSLPGAAILLAARRAP